jgi:hypothetical protein
MSLNRIALPSDEFAVANADGEELRRSSGPAMPNM